MKAIFLDCNDQLGSVWERVIRTDDPKIDVNMTPFKKEELPLVLAGYDIALDDHSYMPTELVARCKQLKHIVFLGTGAASYMNVDELRAGGVIVHTIKGYGDTAVAEHTIALMFAAARDVARMDRDVRGGLWTPQEGVQLFGKTLGVIGLGGIGREVARIAKGLGMEVIGYNRTPQPQAGIFAPKTTSRSRGRVFWLRNQRRAVAGRHFGSENARPQPPDGNFGPILPGRS